MTPVEQRQIEEFGEKIGSLGRDALLAAKVAFDNNPPPPRGDESRLWSVQQGMLLVTLEREFGQNDWLRALDTYRAAL